MPKSEDVVCQHLAP